MNQFFISLFVHDERSCSFFLSIILSHPYSFQCFIANPPSLTHMDFLPSFRIEKLWTCYAFPLSTDTNDWLNAVPKPTCARRRPFTMLTHSPSRRYTTTQHRTKYQNQLRSTTIATLSCQAHISSRRWPSEDTFHLDCCHDTHLLPVTMPTNSLPISSRVAPL